MTARKRGTAVAVAAGLTASVALGQDFGGQEDQTYAAALWQTMLERELAGETAIQAFPYPGTDPHGMMLETFYTEATIDGHSRRSGRQAQLRSRLCLHSGDSM